MYAVIDLETTGGRPPEHRITEVAIYLTDGRTLQQSFHTLVNPERPIPYFVSQMTGITDEMVATAPRFYEVAKQIVELTEGRIFVAHNVSFDYNFLRSAFSELGYNYRRRTLCTVRLSRKLLPGLASYSLGRLCSAVGIDMKGRHRAYGDAAATAELLNLLVSRSETAVHADVLEGEIRAGLLPPMLDRRQIDALPEAPGVYYFHGAAGEVLYVGKSISIRKRVLSHFSGDFNRGSGRAQKNQVAGITFELTGSELVALLHESAEIKKLQPPFNYSQRRTSYRTTLYLDTDKAGYRCLRLGAPGSKTGQALLILEEMRKARRFVERLVESFGLCPRLAGLEKGTGPCFAAQLKKCSGACIGQELPDSYNTRMAQAIASFAYPHSSFVVLGRGRQAGERSVVCVENNRFLGFGYLPADVTLNNPEEVKEYIRPGQDNKNIQALIRGYLLQRNYSDEIRIYD